MKVIVNSLVLILCTALISCKVKDPSEDKPQQQKQDTISDREALIAGTADIVFTITNENQTPLNNVSVDVAGQEYLSDENGRVSISNLSFGNHAVFIAQSGYFPKAGILVNQPNSVTSHIQLETQSANSKSLLFAGDTMFGRRFLDPNLETMGTSVPNVNTALIRPDSAREDSIAITTEVAALFKAADFSSVNLESPITTMPTTVHPTKEFSFFSLPESLQSLTEIGIDYVGLGNNHIYDYLQNGLEDTLLEVSNAGFLNSGAGLSETDAFKTVEHNLDNVNLVLFAATSITGKEHQYTYVADTNKGGAADLTNSAAVKAALEQLDPTDFVIAQMHGGDEYSYTPSPYIGSRFEVLSSQNTDLLIGHHPHIAQGFAVFNEIPAILGLGNFVFDQPRLDTLLGLAVMLDLDTQNQKITRGFAYPIYLEDYKPRFTTGFLSHYLLRRIAELSDDNITLVPRESYAEIYFAANQATKNTQQVTINIDATTDIIDLRQYSPSSAAYVSSIDVNSGSLDTLLVGRDIMVFGDFEDWDNDADTFEVSRWDHSSESVLPCTDKPFNGLQALCSTRDKFDNTPSIIPFRHTMRVMELTDETGALELSKDFSLLTYLQSENGGQLEALLTYTTEIDDLTFAENQIPVSEGGNQPWHVFSHDFSLPSDELTLGPKKLPPRGVKLQFRHYPPNTGEAITRLDDVAMISWQQSINLENGQWKTDKMHGFDFLKVNSSSEVSLTLTFTVLD
ncbi:CapA family protein [Pseudoalteromonas sp. Ps84H-4]|uniref:CapA family protein n=1 Tax=Pseudoalteromonas sp. Ps84H-4 TaxID=2954502 RepID=UPI00209829FB|nr:CapA family protein [Pseudoalteromonas sp. Ps84H-4]MCO7250829.1 CapA family protein [Pseudoalteromonas sp. Ps84H-4]